MAHSPIPPRPSHDTTGLTAGWLLLIGGICFHVTAWGLAARSTWGTWFYHAAWWSYIAAAVGAVRISGRRSEVEGWQVVLMVPWSVAWWVLYDIANLRLQNWYYVLAPPSLPIRWVGFWTAFATVIPLTVVTAELMARSGAFARTRCRRFTITPRLCGALRGAGAACLVMPLLFPRYCYPLIWLFAPLLIEPRLAGRGERSVLRELSQGRPAPLLRVLATGLTVGSLWELFNHGASSRWIYTVPGFDRGKVFEMPLPGFLGFLPFTVGTVSFWSLIKSVFGGDRALEAQRRRHVPRMALISLVLTLPLSVAGFAAVDRSTVRSFTPRVQDVPGWEKAAVPRGYDPCRDEGRVLPASTGERWCRLMSMARHRGLGMVRAVELETLGIRTPEDLARQDPAALLAAWPGDDPPRVSEIRIWITAAPARRLP